MLVAETSLPNAVKEIKSAEFDVNEVLVLWPVRLLHQERKFEGLCRPLIMEARIQSQATPCGIYDEQSDTRPGFSPSASVLPLNEPPLCM
jgi:hypothetical protein